MDFHTSLIYSTPMTPNKKYIVFIRKLIKINKVIRQKQTANYLYIMFKLEIE